MTDPTPSSGTPNTLLSTLAGRQDVGRDQEMTQTIAWDKTKEGIPLLATLTPQQAINDYLPKLSECDFVVVILWSRMGTPLPPGWVKPNGDRYLSGTEWECLNALDAARQKGRPEVLIYYRTEEPIIKLADSKLDEKRDQYSKVKAFIESFKNPDGSMGGSIMNYETPRQFGEMLAEHLAIRIHRRRPEDGRP